MGRGIDQSPKHNIRRWPTGHGLFLHHHALEDLARPKTAWPASLLLSHTMSALTLYVGRKWATFTPLHPNRLGCPRMARFPVIVLDHACLDMDRSHITLPHPFLGSRTDYFCIVFPSYVRLENGWLPHRHH